MNIAECGEQEKYKASDVFREDGAGESHPADTLGNAPGSYRPNVPAAPESKADRIPPVNED